MSKPTKEKNIHIPTEVLMDFLTPSEVRMLKNRWRVAQLLKTGQTVRSIAEQVEVGTDTVIRVAKMFERKKTPKIKSTTPWIFGKSD